MTDDLLKAARAANFVLQSLLMLSPLDKKAKEEIAKVQSQLESAIERAEDLQEAARQERIRNA